MNYLKHYISLIRKRQENIVSIGEKHHIFPVSLFGKNNLTVRLTVREHFIAHKLLYKICEKRYGKKHNRTIRMLFALRMMILDKRNNSARKEMSLIVSSKLMELLRSSHPTMLSEVREKISASKKGKPMPSMRGDNNPAKTPEVGKKISESKKGKPRKDMKGKSYFGASDESIRQGIEKMRQKKIGMKINYPPNRKGIPCSEEKAKNISESRLKTKLKFIEMSNDEFEKWIEKQNLYRKDGRPNPNITRVLNWRNIPLTNYYKKGA